MPAAENVTLLPVGWTDLSRRSKPYNTLAKDKVTLSFVVLLWQTKTAGSESSGTCWFLVQPVGNEVDSIPVQAKDCSMNLTKRAQAWLG
jgi:hypothetical protein